LHAGTGGEGEEWAKAVALGLQLDPGNPLYGGSGSGSAHSDTQILSPADLAASTIIVPEIGHLLAAKPPESPGLDFDLGGSAPPDNAGMPAADVTSNIGFDLDLGGGDKPAAAAQEADGDATVIAGSSVLSAPETATSIDFDFELPASGGTPSAEQASAEPAAGGGLDFDFNLELPATKEEAPAAPLDLSSISLDLGAPGGSAAPADAHWQEVATKLDLAKAYQEMGDKDGARELLNEVLKEGDPAQQHQAQSVLSTLV
jgi:pilus assembly protein FimV